MSTKAVRCQVCRLPTLVLQKLVLGRQVLLVLAIAETVHFTLSVLTLLSGMTTCCPQAACIVQCVVPKSDCLLVVNSPPKLHPVLMMFQFAFEVYAQIKQPGSSGAGSEGLCAGL